MQINIELEGPAYSINKMYYATRKVLTKKARAWQDSVIAQLIPYQLNHQGPLLDGLPLRVEIEVEYPKSFFYNAQGLISSKTMDCSNVEKSLIDVIFTELGTNDKYIVELLSTKKAGRKHGIKVKIQSLD